MSRSGAAATEFSDDAGDRNQAGDAEGCREVRYVGIADWWGRHVWLELGEVRSALPYSDGAMIGFAWGRAGLGARELARSILRHATGAGVEDILCARFVHEVIMRLPVEDFALELTEVLAWLELQG
jgi:hypothetical protein